MAVTFTSNPSGSNGTPYGFYKMADLESDPIVISTSAITVYEMTITGGSGSDAAHVCLYDVNDTVSVGTTVPHAIFHAKVAASFDIRIPDGMSFKNGLVAIIKDEPGTAGSSVPTATANLVLVTS